MSKLEFGEPVTHVYNPLQYAKRPHELYLSRFGAGPKEAVFVGMNPGPFGMGQTGVPFGDVGFVRDWMGIEAPVARPPDEHPKRPVLGFECERSEVSGSRLWGWAKERFGTPEKFFSRFFVINYCPLLFMESTGRNRTPDKLSAAERLALLSACDEPCVRRLRSSTRSSWWAWALGRQNARAPRSATTVLRSAPSCIRAPRARRPTADGRHKPRAICELWASSYKRFGCAHALCSAPGVQPMPKKVVQVAAIMALSLLGLGCGHESAATQQVRSAAAVDLDCDASMIEFVDDQAMVKRVSGCGRTLTYMSKCNPTAGGGQDCRWKPVRDDRNKLN